MKLDKAMKREKQNKKSRYGMKVTGRGCFLAVEIKRKKAKNGNSQ